MTTQTITAPTLAAVQAIAAGFLAAGYVVKATRPSGQLLSHNGALLVIKVSA